jgi:hypothetical protein
MMACTGRILVWSTARTCRGDLHGGGPPQSVNKVSKTERGLSPPAFNKVVLTNYCASIITQITS